MRNQHSHLPRLDRVFTETPIFFITTCTHGRNPILANEVVHGICREVWQNVARYGWSIGRYVVMPDHVHFFCAPQPDSRSLQQFVGKWKEWTAKYAHQRLGLSPPVWESEFFDHLLRSHESYEEKWHYVIENPVRAGFVESAAEWPYQGEMAQLRFD